MCLPALSLQGLCVIACSVLTTIQTVDGADSKLAAVAAAGSEAPHWREVENHNEGEQARPQKSSPASRHAMMRKERENILEVEGGEADMEEMDERSRPGPAVQKLPNITSLKNITYETRDEEGVNSFAIAFGLGLLFFACYMGDAQYRKSRTKAGQAASAGEGEGAEGGGEGAGEGEGGEGEAGEGEAGAGAGAGEAQEAPEKEKEEDEEDLSVVDLSEDIYGTMVACLIRDIQHLANETNHAEIRYFRICGVLGMSFVGMGLQLVMLHCIATLACAKAVGDIRGVYNTFEKHMYNNQVYLNGHGNARGLDKKYFEEDRFKTLDEEVKEGVCRIPFSQPTMLGAVLFIWTLMIVGEIRTTLLLCDRLVMHVETSEDMKEATKEVGEDIIIQKLTKGFKAFLVLGLIVPRFFITVVLLWLGCRWLAATNDFQNLVLNGVGLEFMLLLKDLLYNTMVSDRNKRDTMRTKINISHEEATPSPLAFLGTKLWGLGAFAWVFLYMYSFQAVLPGYRWDVRKVCTSWIEENLDQV